MLQSNFKELEDISLILLLDSLAASLLDDPSASSGSLLLLDLGFSTEDDDSDFTELDETPSDSELQLDPISFELLLDSPDFSLELDCFMSLWVSLDEDFTFSLLDDPCSTEEDDSTPGSSFCPAGADELSSHPTKANAATPIATRNFFTKPPVTRYNKSNTNVIIFHGNTSKRPFLRQKAATSQFSRSEQRTHRPFRRNLRPHTRIRNRSTRYALSPGLAPSHSRNQSPHLRHQKTRRRV